MKKFLFYLFICSLFLFSFVSVKADTAFNYYDPSGYYRFYIVGEQKMVVYENYGNHNYYSAILEYGYGLDETGSYYRQVYQLRRFYNGETQFFL